MIPRIFDREIPHLLKPGKVLVLYGPRRVGKTTLVETFLSQTKLKHRLDTGDDIRIQEVFEGPSKNRIEEFAKGYELIVIDEAQRIPDIGLGLKLLVDARKDLRVIVTGSASFDLSNKVGEPLTGRKQTKILYPIAQMELSQEMGSFDLRSSLPGYLKFGSFPEVLTSESDANRIEYLHEWVSSYLMKDILELERVKSPKLLLDLLRLLAFQIGKDVSLSELGTQLSIDYKTVNRYIDLLEKAFVLIRRRGFSRNLRKEISKSERYYFLDNGIRNALIANFNDLHLRDDVGALWENFVVIERLKRNHYLQEHRNSYFWRTHDKKEIDLVEEKGGQLEGFECKYSNVRVKEPKEFLTTYPNSRFQVIHRENYLDYLL